MFKNSIKNGLLFSLLLCLFACGTAKKSANNKPTKKNEKPVNNPNSNVNNSKPKSYLYPLDISRDAFVKTAKKYVGYKYKYGGKSPATGFDCSGLVYYTLSKFDVYGPRVSRDFVKAGLRIKMSNAQKGDLILFSGGAKSDAAINHIGIITSVKSGEIEFVHAATSKTGVIMSSVSGYWSNKVVAVIRIIE